MSKFMHFIEVLLLPLIAIISFIISLGDFFNIFHLVAPGDIPPLTFLLVSLALGSLCFVQNKCNDIQRDLQRLLFKMELEHMRETVAQIHPDLRRVLNDDYFFNIVHFFQAAVNESKVLVNDVARLRFYFKRTLQSYPRATFLSTTSLATSYLWNDAEIEKALTCFTRAGGKIKQIFFVKNPEELASQEVQAALAHQQHMGIEVRVVNSASIPNDFKQYFFVESRKRLAWEIPINHAGHIGPSVITANKQVTASFCATFERLWAMHR